MLVMQTGYIYLLTSPSGKHYVGQTIDFKKRMYYYSKARCKSQVKLHSAILKYGFENFTRIILAEIEAIDRETLLKSLDALEIAFIKEYNSTATGYNISEGGRNLVEMRKLGTYARVDRFNNRASRFTDYEAKQEIHLKGVDVFKDNVLVNSFKSRIDCCNFYKITTTSLHKWLKAGNDNNWTKLKFVCNAPKIIIEVFKYNTNEKVYSGSMQECLAFVGLKHAGAINRVINGERHHAKGFYFKKTTF